MSATPENLEAIFAAAVERSGPDREAYLARACGSDAALRERVEKLLRALERAGRFLTQAEPAVSTAEPPTATSAGTSGVGAMPVTERPGDRIGRYKLLQQLGEGGCGVVYVAEQEEPVRRRVALKVIRLGMDTKSVIARFEAERQALALMDHPNIAKVLDAGTTETGRPYFVMELIRGIKITDYCDQNHLATQERLALFIQVCHAIQHAHQKGIIHRDIKPSNILVTLHDGVPVPKVIDFGIAKATAQQRLTDKTLYTAFEQFIGTPAYMSPEQAELSGLDVDTRSDVYALGVLLYELLTGKTPFDARALVAAGLNEMRRIIREEEPVRPSTRLSTLMEGELTNTARRRHAEPPRLIHLLRGDLDWIVMRCLEKDRTRRYETATGVAADIQRHLEHEPVVARPPSTLYRVQKFARRNKVMVIASVAVGTALVAGMAVSTWLAWEARKAQWETDRARAGEQAQLHQTQSALKEAEAARQQAQAHALEARRQAYAADVNNAQQALVADDLGRARRLLDAYRPRVDEPGSLDLRGWEWRYLWQQCRNDALGELCRDSNTVDSVAISPDGRLLAVAGRFPEYADLWDLRTRKKIATLPAQAGHPVTFSPLGDVLATAGPDGEVRLYQAGGTNLAYAYRLAHADKRIVALRFSPKEDLLASLGQSWDASLPGGVTVWDLRQRTNLWELPASSRGGLIGSLDFSPDGECLAVGDAEGGLRVVEPRTGAVRFQFTAHSEGISFVAWSPTAPLMATGSGYSSGQIRLWDAQSGGSVGHLDGHTAWISELIFSADGQRLYSASADQTIRVWDVAQQRCLARLRGSTDELYGLALSPDGKTLISGSKDGAVAFWNTDPRPEAEQPRVLPKGKEATYAFSPDSGSLATASDGIVTLYKLPELRHGQPIRELGTNVCTLAYSYDGRRLAGGCTDGMVRVWSGVQQRLVQSLPASEHRIYLVGFLGESDRLFSVDISPTVIEWDADGRAVGQWPFADANALALSPNGRLLVWGDTLGSVHWWDLESGASLGSQPAHRSPVVDVAFTRDSRMAGTVGNDATVAVWDTSLRTPILPPFKGHRHGAHGVAFSPDGRRLATNGGTADEAVKLWDLSTGRELISLPGQGQVFSSVGSSPDGNWLVTRNMDRQLHLWHAPSWEDIAAAETREGRQQ